MTGTDGYTSLNLEYIFLTIYRLLSGGAEGGVVFELARDLWLGISIVCAVAVPIFFFLWLAIKRKIDVLMEEETHEYEALSAVTAGAGPVNLRWREIEELVNSDTPGNWRLAVLEADIMLDDLVKRMGYLGDTLGERLRSIDSATFRTLNQAWEAHRVRNQIAHEGSDFVLSQREARRVIGLFQQVFQEHGMI